MNWPPITMATQHPDNASVPWWRDSAFIPTQDEIDELLLLFKDGAIDEYMWDWEGKYVDESVGEKLFSREHAFFCQRPLGEDLHLTYRIPAFDGDKMHRMARAFMNVLSLSDLAKDIGMKNPPVTEMILPLTTSSEQLLQVREAFGKVAGYHGAVFHQSETADSALMGMFDVIPLVEDVDSLFGIEAILRPYGEQLRKERTDIATRGQRIFLARSDPALNAGLVPSVLAAKAALAITHEVGRDLGFPVHPIIGTGSLPFRGNVNPETTAQFLQQYAGTRTYSIQSAFRYDYPRESVHAALQEIRATAPGLDPQPVPIADRVRLKQVSDVFSALWKPTIEALAEQINAIAAQIPPRRERLQHIGLFGYSRGVGKVKLPRAIGFTAALYSLGIPPELIATGRGLKEAQEKGMLALMQTYYPTLKNDLLRAGAYFNRENLEISRKTQPVYDDIAGDIQGIEEVLGIELGPRTSDEKIHRNMTSTILQKLMSGRGHDVQKEVVEAGVMRKSLG